MMSMQLPSSRSLDLSPLYAKCLFRSEARVKSHEVAAEELAEHDLRWRSGRPDTALYKLVVDRLQMYALRYGAQVEVRPKPFPDQVMVHTALKGPIEVLIDGQRMTIPEGRSGWIAPRRDVKLWWDTSSEHVLLKIPRSLLDDGHEGRALELSPTRLLPGASTSQWLTLTQGLMHAAHLQGTSPAYETWVRHYERLVSSFLHVHEGHDFATVPAQAVDGGHAEIDRSSDSYRVDALLRYVHSHLAAPVSLADLAHASGTSLRILQALCKRQLGLTPMEVLRNARLDAARSKLAANRGLSVTTIALELGFGHLGRFSHYYFQRFGELPSATSAGSSKLELSRFSR